MTKSKKNTLINNIINNLKLFLMKKNFTCRNHVHVHRVNHPSTLFPQPREPSQQVRYSKTPQVYQAP